jgi:hypothetical protein
MFSPRRRTRATLLIKELENPKNNEILIYPLNNITYIILR